jgi:hypothetical protein
LFLPLFLLIGQDAVSPERLFHSYFSQPATDGGFLDWREFHTTFPLQKKPIGFGRQSFATCYVMPPAHLKIH